MRNDSKQFRFCRSKCHKNFKMKRNPRKVKWTKAYRMLHGKELQADAAFDFERRRNRPVKYNRDVTRATLEAMKSLESIRARRGERFYTNRRRGVEDERRRSVKKELAQQVHLVQATKLLTSEHDVDKLSNTTLKVYATQATKKSLYE